MTVSSIVAHGYGSWSNINYLATLGYSQSIFTSIIINLDNIYENNLNIDKNNIYIYSYTTLISDINFLYFYEIISNINIVKDIIYEFNQNIELNKLYNYEYLLNINKNNEYSFEYKINLNIENLIINEILLNYIKQQQYIYENLVNLTQQELVNFEYKIQISNINIDFIYENILESNILLIDKIFNLEYLTTQQIEKIYNYENIINLIPSLKESVHEYLIKSKLANQEFTIENLVYVSSTKIFNYYIINSINRNFIFDIEYLINFYSLFTYINEYLHGIEDSTQILTELLTKININKILIIEWCIYYVDIDAIKIWILDSRGTKWNLELRNKIWILDSRDTKLDLEKRDKTYILEQRNTQYILENR